VNARNQADQLLHSVKKSLAEHGDKIDAKEKAAIEEASKALEAVLKDGDKATLEEKTQALATASQKLGEKAYAQAQAEAQAKSAGGAGGQPKEKEVDATVVDAEYEEVKDKKSA